MSYTLTTTYTRPSTAVAWWRDARPVEHTSWNTYMGTVPGVISTSVANPSNTVTVTTIVFQDQASCRNFLAAAATHPTNVSRGTYLASNNITFAFQEQ